MKYDSAQLAEAIKKAVAAAQSHANDDDGGTCNFDAAYIKVPGMWKKQASDIETLSGVRLSLWEDHAYFGRILMLSGTSGQGNRRTRMAEAMRHSLEADGVESGMYYQMD